MILTTLIIKVTHQMMDKNNMTRGDLYGVPIDPANFGKGLSWKKLREMTTHDFGKIEEYFILKKQQLGTPIHKNEWVGKIREILQHWKVTRESEKFCQKEVDENVRCAVDLAQLIKGKISKEEFQDLIKIK